jgi:predicted ATPase
MIDKISFKGYKSFKDQTELEIKPITVIFGKNSSGKSAIVKLPTLIEGSLSGEFDEPLMYINNGVELGADYRDLFYNRGIIEQLDIGLTDGNNRIEIGIINSTDKPVITEWKSFSLENENEIITTDEIDKSKGNNLFSGFLPKNKLSKIKEKISLKTDYIGPFRLYPPRVFHLTGRTNFERIGNKGENAYQILVNDELLATKVSDWFNENFDGWELYINKVESYYEIKIKRYNSQNEGVNIVDVGQGMSQALPIIVKAHMKNTIETLTILEQPELHLHPGAHANLAQLLFESTQNSGNKYLVETHSKNFILRLRTLVAEEKLNKENINLYYVYFDESQDSSYLKKIELNDLGEVDFWPKNVFDESFDEVKALMRAQNKSK